MACAVKRPVPSQWARYRDPSASSSGRVAAVACARADPSGIESNNRKYSSTGDETARAQLRRSKDPTMVAYSCGLLKKGPGAESPALARGDGIPPCRPREVLCGRLQAVSACALGEDARHRLGCEEEDWVCGSRMPLEPVKRRHGAFEHSHVAILRRRVVVVPGGAPGRPLAAAAAAAAVAAATTTAGAAVTAGAVPL
eukprot:scaffold21635_cov101-Isochrysis_galbana.AAC.2